MDIGMPPSTESRPRGSFTATIRICRILGLSLYADEAGAQACARPGLRL